MDGLECPKRRETTITGMLYKKWLVDEVYPLAEHNQHSQAAQEAGHHRIRDKAHEEARAQKTCRSM
jgi:hypothetical protein